MPVRNATEDDLDEICAMVKELADFEESGDEVDLDPEDLRRHVFGPDPAAHVLIAHPAGDPGTVAGMALWFRTYSTWVGRPGVWLEDLFVRPAHRRAGLARELLDALAARTDGRVEWAVLDWNRGAIDFYDGLGAKPVEGWTRYRWLPGSAG
ncbi:GNAT family N-acetyltransferase [Acidiferrimicrobium sp. IK]|uniref:GNAT family N-acetyltransferase n=1 Tax=Acidiferrimicrobium sp. IK TaxID=2871700 RepID=UPI0021CB3FBA|nr:GNAT family N-acetyltransferase [Acidiferrimicrobium sp. IK]MCU4183950.1 GNAT family N-acetyltransferase [Acidiferrimicrobium sp. IK]